MTHLAFAVQLCMEQLKGKRHFVFEHPVAARSWGLDTLKQLQHQAGVEKVTFDFCALGMMGEDQYGKAPIRKRTSVLTSSSEVAARLRERQCSGEHRHVQLTGRGTKTSTSMCQVYPD